MKDTWTAPVVVSRRSSRSLASVVAVVVILCGCKPAEPQDPVSKAVRALTSEFAAAYPTDVNEHGTGREYELDAAPTRLPMFNGRPLDFWAYNGQVPGPILRAKVGERLRVRFTNHLPLETTVHWHGVRVPNAMDGVPGVTQPPVQPGGSFVYEFVPKDAGTFWFHPHLRSSEQVERGLFGVLIVDEAEPPAYTKDVVWVLDDWRLGRDGQVDPNFVTRHDLAHDGRWGNVVTVNGHLRETLEVRPGERLRLRLVNTANGRVFVPDFGELDAQVIAVDGLYAAVPRPAKGYEIAPGNRLDLDITIPTGSAGREFEVVDRFTRQPIRLASVRVSGVAVETPRFPSPARAKIPMWTNFDVVPARSIVLNAERGGPYGISWTLNGVAHVGHHNMEPSESLALGKFARLRFENASYRLHPVHMHGVFFKVLSRNGVPVSEPNWRDTVLVHARETVDVGLVPLDAGDWMLHCHILEHAEAGMMTTVRVRAARAG